jgi:hypothetical protein
VTERWATLDKIVDHYGEPDLDVRRIVGWWFVFSGQ